MSRSTWLRTILLLVGGCSLPALGSVQLERIEDAVDHPKASTLAFLAESRPDVRGVFISTLRHPAAVGASEPSRTEVWVVPLQSPGQPHSEEILAWVGMRDPVAAGTGPEAWLKRLAAELDGRPMTLKVGARAGQAGDRVGTWREAITDAELRHGVRSHPDAPVFSFPKR